MGGLCNLDDEVSCLSDVILYNIETGGFDKRVENFKGLEAFQSTSNKCMQFEENTVIALVENNYLDKEEEAFVVEFKKGTHLVKKIMQL